MGARRPTTPESRKAQSRLAAAVRDHGPDDPATQAARIEWEQLSYIARVRAALENPPAMTREQMTDLSEAWDTFRSRVQIVRPS